MPILRVENLSVVQAGQVLLKDISFNCEAGELITIVGPNGAGKSTLLRAILGLMPLTTGSVKKKPGLVIGYMPQKLLINPLLPLKVKNFLKLAAKSSKEPLARLLALCQIEHLQNADFMSLSGGEIQRVLLVRALLRDPKLLILDEPAQGVDLQGQAELYRLLSEIQAVAGCGILMVSHDLQWVMSGTARVLCLNQHLCCSGRPEELSQNPEFIKIFQGQPLALYQHQHNHRHDLKGHVCT